MGKIIFWIVVFFLVLLALRLVSVYKTREDEKERRSNEAKPDAKDAKRDDKPPTDVMIKCTRCGVFVPKATSVMTPTGLACNDGSCRHRR